MSLQSQSVELVEVGPRDGLQSEARVLPTASKVEFIRRLVASGLTRIEVASFVNPKRVPQMADAEAVLAALRSSQPAARYIGLVLNRKGFDRAREAGCGEVGMAIAASESFSQRNQGLSVDEGIAAWLDIASAARSAGIRAQVTISTAFGCPFEGEVPVSRVREIAERLAAGSPDEIAVADTIGVAVPTQVTELIAVLRAALPEHETAGAFPQHAQYRPGQCLCGRAVGCGCAGRQLWRHRWLPVRPRGHRQHSQRGSLLHAGSHGHRAPVSICPCYSKPAAGCRTRCNIPFPAWSSRLDCFPEPVENA